MPVNSNNNYWIRLALVCSLAFFSAWADVLSVVRYQCFVGQMTGNTIYFGLSIAPSVIREQAGVFDEPGLYLCVILFNNLGVFFVRILERWSNVAKKRIGFYTAIFTLVLGIAGNISAVYIARNDDNNGDGEQFSPWHALFFAPIFGAINAMTASPPLSTSAVTLTANVQKIPKWVLSCLPESPPVNDDNDNSHNRFRFRFNFVPPDIGCVVPFAALAGSAFCAGLLWINDEHFFLSPWCSLPIFFGLSVTLIAHDMMLPYLLQVEEPLVEPSSSSSSLSLSSPPTPLLTTMMAMADDNSTNNNNNNTTTSLLVEPSSSSSFSVPTPSLTTMVDNSISEHNSN